MQNTPPTVDGSSTSTTAVDCGETRLKPTLRDALLSTVAGAIVGVALGGADVPFGRALAAAVATGVGLIAVAMMFTRLLAPVHAHCDECNACSVLTGVPTGAADARLDRELIAAGWTVDGNATVCPACVEDEADNARLIEAAIHRIND